MKKVIYICVIAFTFIQCKEIYAPSVVASPTSYLVVDGFINSNGTTTITLSRTTKIYDSAVIQYEPHAIVTVESDANENYMLYENSNGIYSASFNLQAGNKYRLHIKTADGKEYVSDYSAVIYTPPIDSISWQRDNGGVQVYVNTVNNPGATKYYQWTYSETWEFHSPFISYLDYVKDVAGTAIDLTGRSILSTDTLYYCWKTQNSTNLILGSSEKLSENKILQPIRFIEENAEELSVLYYIKIKQYALSEDAYLFNTKLKKNTEQLGTIFDPQPSELSGNIHCITNPGEQVIGFVEVSQEQEKEIFVSNAAVTPWAPPVTCSSIVIYNKPDSMNPFANAYIPLIAVEKRGLLIIRFSAATISCVDCGLRGTNVKPSFWP